MDHDAINPNVRIPYVLKDSKWVQVNGMDIKEGMIFKMFEPDGVTPVLGWNDTEIFTASSDSYMDDNGIIHTEIED